VARKILVLHLRQLGRYDEALEQISTATRLDPEAIWAYILLGSLLAEAGREDEAEGAFNQAIAMDPSNAEAHNDLGVLKHSQGYYDEAVVQFREARKRDRHNRAYLENLSGALIEAGIRQAINDQPHMALESMREALELTPKSFFANHRMARLLANDRKFKEAETHFKQAVASDADVSRASPADIAQAHFELGVMLARLDRMLEARRAFEQALELHPEFPAAKAALHRTRMALGTRPRDTEE
jgi:Flp pilus assembly protein TadD